METVEADPAGQRRTWCNTELRTLPSPILLSETLTLSQLEWLTAVPWPGSSTTAPSNALETLRDRAFLKNARKQLDADHFGLEKIKKRLIEYLAVVRLKALQMEQEEKAEQSALVLAPKVPSQVEVLQQEPEQVKVSVPPRASQAKRVKGPILL